MDNRLKFLYHVSSELWGHRRTAHPGNGNTGASEVGVRKEKPPYKIRRRDAERTEVAKHPIPAAKKSRYCVARARTVNRHRWMRRES